MNYICFTVAALSGLVLVLIYLVAVRLHLSATDKLWKFICVMTSMVGVALIAVAVVAYSNGSASFADVIRNSLSDTEMTLRHWFQSLSLR
jgi:hypothetical protein